MRMLAILFFGLFPSFVFAAGENIPKDRKITQLVVYENLVLVQISPAFANNQGCSSSSNSTLQLDFNSEVGTNTGLLSTLLAAASASKDVGFGINGCAGQYPKIYRVDVMY